MPTIPKRVCITPRCGKVAERGAVCDSCRSAREQERGNSAERGYSHAWRKYAASFLRRFPFCNDPFYVHRERGELVQAKQVDHVVAHRGNRELFWSASNHQGLCASCHSRKTVECDSGFGRDGRNAFRGEGGPIST